MWLGEVGSLCSKTKTWLTKWDWNQENVSLTMEAEDTVAVKDITLSELVQMHLMRHVWMFNVKTLTFLIDLNLKHVTQCSFC